MYWRQTNSLKFDIKLLFSRGSFKKQTEETLVFFLSGVNSGMSTIKVNYWQNNLKCFGIQCEHQQPCFLERELCSDCPLCGDWEVASSTVNTDVDPSRGK